MKKSIDLIRIISIILLGIVFFSQFYSNITTLVIFFVTFFVSQMQINIQDAAVIAIIFSSIIAIINPFQIQNIEGFASGKKSEQKILKKKKKKKKVVINGKKKKKIDDEGDNEDEGEGENEDEEKIENFNKDVSDGEGGTETDEEGGSESEEEDDTESEEEQESYVDIGTSFLEAYKNLSPNQIKSMTKDTKELLNVQKNLMKTIEGLTPIVKEGKNVLDTFKGYFNDLK